MNNKELYYKHVEAGMIKHQTPEERIQLLANKLIDSLYVPVKGITLFRVDWSRVKLMKIDTSEPINWGDLSTTVEAKGPNFLITIEEASPGECSTLCEYVEKYLTDWGWDNIEVITEW